MTNHTTPTNPADADLRERLAVALQEQLDGDWTTNNTIAFMEYFGDRAAEAALTVVAPVLEGLRAEIERLQQIADNAITALEKLREEQLDRIAPVECDCAEHGVDCHAVAAQFAYLRAIRIVRPSVSDQTPVTPDDACNESERTTP